MQRLGEYTYDNRNNVLAVKDAKGNTRTFQYDRNDRLTKDTRPLGQSTIYQYGAQGNVVRQTDSRGQRIENEYDDAGRLTKTNYFASENDTNPYKTVIFSYDGAANLTGYDDGTTSATYIYDDAYRKLSETVNYGNFELNYFYTYYKNGLKKNLTMPDGTTYEYTYDNNNQISMISVPGQGSMTYNKYRWYLPVKITLPGGNKMETAYTPLMQPKSITVKDPKQNLLMNYNYEYSPGGNVKAKNTENGNYAYQYDDLYRLTGATNPTAPNESYTYDPVGNRLTSTDIQGNWAYNENNELLGYNGVSYEYDANGNTISKTDQTGTVTYSYDIDNRLIQLTTHNPPLTTHYYYDPLGKRLWKDVDGVRTYFLYSDEGLIGEYDSTGGEIKTYGYVPDSDWTTKPLFQKVGTNHYWYQNDHLGTPQKIVDSNGRVVWSATYGAFGNIQVTTADIENNLRLPGQYYDKESGLHYNYHRYYNLEIGRYMAPDPIGLGGGINVYAYVLNNPIKSTDSLGLWIGRIHKEITRTAAISSDCEKGADDLADANADVDSEFGSQDPENAFWHGMVNGKNPKDQWIKDVEKWVDRVEKGRNSCDKYEIGRALHALQDFYAPAHRFKPWNGSIIGYLPHWSDFFMLPSAYQAGSASRELLSGIRGRCPCLCQCLCQ